MKFLLTLPFFMICAFGTASAQTDDYSIHAMFIYNFVKYIEWPNGKQQISIGVLDNKQATASITKMASSKSGLKVENISFEQASNAYQIIFVPANNNSKCLKLSEKLKDNAVLIITEEPNMVKKGAGISFKIVDGKMKFQMNKEAVAAKGLKVAGNLSTLALE